MREYPKIQTIFKRDLKTKRIVLGDFSLPELAYLKDNRWIFTEKVDGTNIRVLWDGEKLSFGGKTDEAQIPAPLLTHLTELINEDTARTLFGAKEVCLYGEGYGKKIGDHGELYKPDGVDFVLFDVLIDGWWLARQNIEDVALRLGVGAVPTVGEGTLTEMVEIVKAGFKSRWGDFTAEGIVASPAVELKNRKGERIMAKIKRRDFI